MQTAPMTLETIPPQAAAPMRRWPMPALLALVALCQTAGALYIWPIFFDDLSALAGQSLDRWITTVVIALSPFAAIATLVFALTGRLRFSIMAMATLSLLDWSRLLPKIFRNGLEFYPSMYDLMQFYVLPALCIAAIVLAARNTRLVAATLMAVTPSVLNGLGWLAFYLVVSIYGF